MVDEDGDGRGGEGVAGLVGRLDAQVVGAVGDGVRSAAVFQLAAVAVHVPAPAGLRWKTTVSTPEPPTSAESLVRLDRRHADLGARGGGRDRAGRGRVVDADRDRRRR